MNEKKRRRIFAAVMVIICVILLPVVAINLTLIIKGYVKKEEVPSLFSVAPMYVMTDSMVPNIHSGDLVFIKKVRVEEIAEDDVIAFFEPDNEDRIAVVHRVKNIFTDQEGRIYFQTKGDANPVMDISAVPAENVIGKYVGRIRGMGRVAMFLQSTEGLVLSVSVPLIILLGYQVIREYAAYKKLQTEAGETPKNEGKGDGAK